MIRSAHALLLIAALAATSACSPSGEGGGGASDAPETLVIGVSTQPDHLNPLISNFALSSDLENLMFLRLSEFGPAPDYDLVPQLSERWEISEDGREVIHHLRRDIRWHDGVPTTAYDVEFTFDRATDPDVPFPSRGKVRDLESWEALDEWTVRFVFREPSWEPIFDTQIHIVPKHLLEDVPPAELMNHGFSRNPVGNGPWKFVRWLPEEQVVLARNEEWPDGGPYFERVVFRIIPETTTMRTELLTGRIDFFPRYPNKYFRDDESNPELTFPRFSDRGYVYIGWNLKNPLFQDVRVRRALTYATDRQTILDGFRDGFGKVAAVPLFLDHPDWNPSVTPLPFDPPRAAALLDEAGWTERDRDGVRKKDGQRFEITFMLIANNEISEEIATMVQAEYEKLGIAVQSEYFETTVYLKRLRAKDFEATVLARRGELIFDPEDIFHSRSIETQFNDVSFGNPVTDSLIDLAKSTRDREERRKIWWEFQKELERLHPVTILYVSAAANPVRREAVEDPVMDLRGPYYRITEWKPGGGS